MIIAGGGFSGTIAAYTVLKNTGRQKSVLLLDNHPVIGGEAKRNEFIVRGQRLIGPQGSNESGVPDEKWLKDIWDDVGLPTEFEFGTMGPHRRPMVFPYTNYQYQFWSDDFENHGFFYDTPSPHWVRNPWGHNLEGTPYPDDVKRDLLRWRNERVEPWKGDRESLKLWLDTMTYEQYLTNVRKLHPEVSRYIDPIYASGIGLGADVLSAWSAYELYLPGFVGLGVDKAMDDFVSTHTMTPDRQGNLVSRGNDGMQRCIVKWLNPEAIDGAANFPAIHSGRIRFDMLDRPGTPCRMRAGATVVHVVQHGEGPSGTVVVTYAKDGALHRVRARSLIWSAASWTAKHAMEGLPEEYRTAMESFPRSPMLSVNVALDNWRFLYDLGYSACSWRGGFGFTANIRPNMYWGTTGRRSIRIIRTCSRSTCRSTSMGCRWWTRGRWAAEVVVDELPGVRDADLPADGDVVRGIGVRSEAGCGGDRAEPVGPCVLQRGAGVLHAEEREADAGGSVAATVGTGHLRPLGAERQSALAHCGAGRAPRGGTRPRDVVGR